ncbi:putative defense protein Hdd11-like [Maniola jurtina]|uniref:putative defense protein Hdd11-like n=1 Tax=Maniola jurtina TaxID=191418 RepID=UPI001E68E572|nr:putative defense protein Hdd11-like [Maniola jurtina]
MWFAYFASILALVALAQGYGDGAPPSACKDMIPRHPVPPQSTPAPYTITPSTKVVKAGTPMEVTISGNSAADTIRGIMLQARAGAKIVGTFKVDPDDRLARLMKCDVQGDTITHKRHDPKDDKQTVSFTWTPPADLNDNIKFRATIAYTGEVFWVGLESAPVKVTL